MNEFWKYFTLMPSHIIFHSWVSSQSDLSLVQSVTCQGLVWRKRSWKCLCWLRKDQRDGWQRKWGVEKREERYKGGKVKGRERESMVWFPVRQSHTADMEGIAGNQATEGGLMQLIYSLWRLKRHFCENSLVFSSLFNVICLKNKKGNNQPSKCPTWNLMIHTQTESDFFLLRFLRDFSGTSRCQAGPTHQH